LVNGWVITYETFSDRRQALTEMYCTHTKIFPQILTPTNEEIESMEQEEHLFINKIEDIKYYEIKNEAITQYIEAQHMIFSESRNYSVPKEAYDSYVKELADSYIPKFRNAKLKFTDSDDPIKKSKIFYNSIIDSSVQPFHNFSNTPSRFRNGIYQHMADDEKKDIIWDLSPGDENE